MRAREPDRVGDVDRDGVAIHYEVFGSGPATVLLLGAFPVVDGQQWKGQVPYLARHFRVVTVDPRGNGLSGRPPPRGLLRRGNVGDVLAVLDAPASTRRSWSGSAGARAGRCLAHSAPDRVLGLVAIAPGSRWRRPAHVIEHIDARALGRQTTTSWVDYHSA